MTTTQRWVRLHLDHLCEWAVDTSGYCCRSYLHVAAKFHTSASWAQVAAHNYVRCRHGQPALSWQDSTATHSQNWAGTCTYAHSGPSGFENGGAGENLATSSYAKVRTAFLFPSPGEPSGSE